MEYNPATRKNCDLCCFHCPNENWEQHLKSTKHLNRFKTKFVLAGERLYDFSERHYNIQGYHEYLWKQRDFRKCIEKTCESMLSKKEEMYIVRCKICMDRRKHHKLVGDHKYYFQYDSPDS